MPTEQLITDTFPSTYTEGNTPTPLSPELRQDRNPFDNIRPELARGSSDSGRTRLDSPQGSSGSGAAATQGRDVEAGSSALAVEATARSVTASPALIVPVPPAAIEGPLSTLVVDDDK